MIPAARTAGHALAFTALALACAAAAQGPISTTDPGAGGGLAWVFAIFVGLAVLGIFLFVLWLVQAPQPRLPGATPRAAHSRR